MAAEVRAAVSGGPGGQRAGWPEGNPMRPKAAPRDPQITSGVTTVETHPLAALPPYRLSLRPTGLLALRPSGRPAPPATLPRHRAS